MQTIPVPCKITARPSRDDAHARHAIQQHLSSFRFSECVRLNDHRDRKRRPFLDQQTNYKITFLTHQYFVMNLIIFMYMHRVLLLLKLLLLLVVLVIIYECMHVFQYITHVRFYKIKRNTLMLI